MRHKPQDLIFREKVIEKEDLIRFGAREREIGEDSLNDKNATVTLLKETSKNKGYLNETGTTEGEQEILRF